MDPAAHPITNLAFAGRLAGELGLIRGLWIEAALLLLLALFSGAEAAILAANRLRARQDAESGIKGAKALVALHDKKEDFLPSLLALETLLTVLISSLGTAFASAVHAGAETLFIAAILITGCVLVFGEIIPKTVATHHPDRFSYLVSPLILFLTRILSLFLRPVTWSLGFVVNLFGRNPQHVALTEKELKYLISLSREHGILNKEEEELFQNIFDFTDSRVGEVMIPRTKIESVQENATLKELLDKFAESRYSRYPVYAKNLDNILGFLDVRDLLAASAKGESLTDLKKFIRPVTFVPESKQVGSLLQDMRKENFQVAIVVDEYGGTAGFVSMTDLLEEIVGKLPVEQPGFAPEQGIRPVDEKTVIVPAATKLEEMEERLGVKFEAKDVHTVGGLVFGLFGRVPDEGEQIRYLNLKFTVTEKDGYKISKVMVTKEPNG